MKYLYIIVALAAGQLLMGQNLTQLEYFIDSDPGFGSGTPVTITPTTQLDETFSVDLNSTSEGLHVLYVRVKDEDDNWSLYSQQPFLKLASALGSQEIDYLEYFFDADPGLGNGTELSAPQNDSINATFAIDLSMLSDGLHTIYVRAQDSDGEWSLMQNSPFLKVPSAAGTSQITDLEYFFDTDPGIGNGHSHSFPATDSLNETISLDLSSLSTGIHVLYVRVKDSDGDWSLIQNQTFLKTPITTSQDKIIQMEYFFDNDPGFGNGVQVSISQSTSINHIFRVDFPTNFSDGVHVLYVRVKDVDGSWSLVQNKPFLKAPDFGSSSPIVEMEYFIGDDDPGLGNGINEPIVSGHFVEETILLDISTFQDSLYRFSVRVKNDDGAWSPTESYSFSHTSRIEHWHRIVENGHFNEGSKLREFTFIEATEEKFSVCADGANASFFKVIGSANLNPNNTVIRIEQDPYGNNPEIFGSFGNISINANELIVEYTHPNEINNTINKTKLITLEVYDVLLNKQLVEVDLEIYRPPILMVHGLWGNREAFKKMKKALDKSDYYFSFQSYIADYEPYHANGFSANGIVVPNHINYLISNLNSLMISSGKVDIVAHSMGGIISRYYLQSEVYRNDIHKLITLNTPHSGSQAANLILDEDAGNLSSLFCDKILPRFFGSCEEGAVEDLNVYSPAIKSLNTSPNLNKKIVPVHAIITTKTIGQQTNVLRFFPKAMALLSIPIRNLDQCFNEMFGGAHDIVVSTKSQGGGLSLNHTTEFNNQFHIGVADNKKIQSKVIELLTINSNDPQFCQTGFEPDSLDYTTPCNLANFKELQLAEKSDYHVVINNPTNSTAYNLGDTLNIEVSGSSNLTDLIVLIEYNSDLLLRGEQAGNSGTFEFIIDSIIIGNRNIVAIGYDSLTQTIVIDSLNILLNVEDKIDSITINPSNISININEPQALNITAHFPDFETDISNLPELNYLFSEGIVRKVGNNIIEGYRLGTDTLVIGYKGKFSDPIPIEITLPVTCSYPQFLSLSNDTLALDLTLHSSDSIEAKSIILDSANVIFKAVTSIDLLPDFETQLGATFLTVFENCIDTIRFDSCLIVSNTNDTGIGSLRNAMSCAQDGDVIDFHIPGFVPFIIQPLSPLPELNQNDLTIDSRTLSEYFKLGDIIIDGSMMTGDGIVYNGNSEKEGLKINGLQIQNFENGIVVKNTENFVLKNNDLNNNENGIAVINSQNGIINHNIISENDNGILLDSLIGTPAPENGLTILYNKTTCNQDTTIQFNYSINDAPAITLATTDTLSGTTSTPFQVVQIYSSGSTTCANGNPIPCQGKHLLGMTTSDKNGEWALIGAFSSGEFITVTGTDLSGFTSGFAECVEVVP